MGILLLLLSMAHASLDLSLQYAYQLDANNQPVSQIFNHPAPRFADLEKNKNQFKNYEEFLSYLELSYPNLFDHFVLLHHSQSLQKASPDHPRVILFDGGVTMAFSDHPDQVGRRAEMIEVEPGTYKMSFREISFSPSGAVTFEAQPQSCVACHGSPARPIWSPYDFWAGAFGSNVGRPMSTEEREAHKNLQAVATEGILSRLTSVTQEPASNVEALTQYLQMLNLGRWVQENIPTDVQEAPYIPALAYVLSECSLGYTPRGEENLRSLFPSPLLSSFGISYADVKKDSDEAFLSYRTELESQYKIGFPQAHIEFPTDVNRLRDTNVNMVTQLRWLFENLGKDWRSVSTGFNSIEYFIMTPTRYSLDLLTALSDLRPQYFKGLRPIPVDMLTGASHWVRYDCQQLKEKSILFLSSLTSVKTQTFKPFFEPATSNSPIASCMKCHGVNSDARADATFSAPQIPFDQPTQMSSWLKKSKGAGKEIILDRVSRTDAKQMPPKRRLSVEEIASVKAYLNFLEESP